MHFTETHCNQHAANDTTKKLTEIAVNLLEEIIMLVDASEDTHARMRGLNHQQRTVGILQDPLINQSSPPTVFASQALLAPPPRAGWRMQPARAACRPGFHAAEQRCPPSLAVQMPCRTAQQARG